MADVTNELIFNVLKEVQAGQAEQKADTAELRAQIATLAQGQVNMRVEITGMRSDIKVLTGYVQEVAIILDHHSRRLDRIEHHLELNKPPH